ncbi:hypothetical protein Pa4123_58130 [Phytohabitans aurantiacus]|uniref:Uncharacterized protein n=1 Tax=Phytohabitans aurantiacus TaxID=3016789 RepID=A0ABQ5R3S8_9ACTN|nr:hypothetical protein Pa4123_58130 [Phytohabitans aurantiacus]
MAGPAAGFEGVGGRVAAPCALRAAPCALRAAPCALRAAPCALRAAPRASIKAICVDQGQMHAEMRSNRVRSPLIGVRGVATRRTGLVWGRTHAEKRSNRVRSPLIGGG